MRAGSRPISSGTTWSCRYAATASSRPLRVASPTPVTPSSVMIFRVTKLRPGQVTMTRASDDPHASSSTRDLRPGWASARTVGWRGQRARTRAPGGWPGLGDPGLHHRRRHPIADLRRPPDPPAHLPVTVDVRRADRPGGGVRRDTELSGRWRRVRAPRRQPGSHPRLRDRFGKLSRASPIDQVCLFITSVASGKFTTLSRCRPRLGCIAASRIDLDNGDVRHATSPS